MVSNKISARYSIFLSTVLWFHFSSFLEKVCSLAHLFGWGVQQIFLWKWYYWSHRHNWLKVITVRCWKSSLIRQPMDYSAAMIIQWIENSYQPDFFPKLFVRDDVHIHLATLISQRPIVGTRAKSESGKPWQKWIILIL